MSPQPARYVIEATDHVGVTVSALDPAIRFFSGFLDSEPTSRRLYEDAYIAEVTGVASAAIDVAYFDLSGTTRLELLHYLRQNLEPIATPAVPASAHISMRVDDIESAFASACDMGATPVGPRITEITSGPNAGGKMVYLRVPGDVIVELFQPARHSAPLGDMEAEARRMKVKSNRPWNAGYSRAIRVGDIIEVSGTVASDDEGRPLHEGDLKAQVETCIQVISAALDELGANLTHVTRTRLFIRDLSRWMEAAEAHSAAFGEIEPACSFLGVSDLLRPEFLVEMEATAIVDSD